MSYTKLFTEIIHSTIWTSSLTDKVVWITMLAMADDRGQCRASVPGLARIAGVSREECLIALNSFLKPDIDSRSQEYEGRRIKEIDGGWLLINHAKYRQLRSAEERKKYQADWMANKRRKDKESEKETKKFIKPNLKDIEEYCLERKNNINANEFFDSNEMKGWVVGTTKTPMKDWKACIRTWEKNNNQISQIDNQLEGII